MTLDQNRTDAYGFRERTDQSMLASPTLGDVPLIGKLWRDNRAADQKKLFDVDDELAQRSVSPARRGQLALNDSLAVDLPGGARVSAADSGKIVADSARALSQSAVAAAPAQVLSSDSQFSNARPQPPAPPVEPPKESLRAVGRISLAVDFPQEGQVYHFEKLKADARLTLWSARPGRFAPLGWLGVLLSIWLVWWAMRRRTARATP